MRENLIRPASFNRDTEIQFNCSSVDVRERGERLLGHKLITEPGERTIDPQRIKMENQDQEGRGTDS